jgi:hypothetical protein
VVALERTRRGVIGKPVDLDNDPSPAPEQVDDVVTDAGVDDRVRKASCTDQLEETTLGLGAGQGRVVIRLEEGPQAGGAAVARVAIDKGEQSVAAGAVSRVRLGDRLLEVARACVRREVGSVRAGVVTGIRWRVVVSSAGSMRTRWMTMPGFAPGSRALTVTDSGWEAAG